MVPQAVYRSYYYEIPSLGVPESELSLITILRWCRGSRNSILYRSVASRARVRLVLAWNVWTVTVDTGLGVVLARSFITMISPTLKILISTVATAGPLHHPGVESSDRRCEAFRFGRSPGALDSSLWVNLLHVRCEVAVNGVDDRTNLLRGHRHCDPSTVTTNKSTR